MKLVNLAFALAALAIGAGAAWSTGEWMDSSERGTAELKAFTQDLLASAGLFELHNQVHAKVGPEAWENLVKPQFMSAITYATIRETGNVLPEGRDVVEWVRSHPQEARRLMIEASRLDPAR
ncbi:MAG: hypothetical protein L0170_18735 [Acidobacteria bacterium]|nr:hypothetical protein [Acidobacteriota bacterium]